MKISSTKNYPRKLWQLGILLGVLGVVFGSVKPVLAYTQNDLQCIYYNTCGYDPTDTTQPVSSCGVGAVDVALIGSDNEEKAWNFLTGKGLSNAQAAGVMGNLYIESKYDPQASNKGGYTGIAQWNTDGRWAKLVAWAKDNQLDENSFDTQMQYLWKEATDRGNIDGIKKYDGVKETAWYWGRYFEVAIINGNQSEEPLTNVQNLAGRTSYAQAVYDKYSGSSGPVPVSETTEEANDDTNGITPASDGCPDDGGGGSGVIGIGKGDFVDTGNVKGYQTVLANASAVDKEYGDALRYKGWCASIVTYVWHGRMVGFGYSPHYAMTLYSQGKKSGVVHQDHKAKVGSILLYTGGTVYGHVTIYLGNNKILNDGHIENATEKGKDFLGWVDPNDIGWTAKPINSSTMAALEKFVTPASL